VSSRAGEALTAPIGMYLCGHDHHRVRAGVSLVTFYGSNE